MAPEDESDSPFYFEFGQKYHIVIQQFPVEDNVKVEIDGQTVHSKENSQAKSFPGMKLYIADPWYPAFTSNYGLLENLKVTNFFCTK